MLTAKWDALYAKQMGVEDFKLLAAETRSFLKNAVPQRTAATKEQLMEIMMAQDFQDLTGQVIKKVVALAQQLESQLMGILIETIPGEKRTESVTRITSYNVCYTKLLRLMDVTTEGLRIQIIDEKNRPMFDSSSAELSYNFV